MEIFKPIVCFVAVDVMNCFQWCKRSAKMLFHNVSMLKHINAIDAYETVASLSAKPPIRSLAFSSLPFPFFGNTIFFEQIRNAGKVKLPADFRHRHIFNDEHIMKKTYNSCTISLGNGFNLAISAFLSPLGTAFALGRSVINWLRTVWAILLFRFNFHNSHYTGCQNRKQQKNKINMR